MTNEGAALCRASGPFQLKRGLRSQNQLKQPHYEDVQTCGGARIFVSEGSVSQAEYQRSHRTTGINTPDPHNQMLLICVAAGIAVAVLAVSIALDVSRYLKNSVYVTKEDGRF